MNIQNAFDGKTARVGDKVWSIQLGDAEIVEIGGGGNNYPIGIKTDDGQRDYYTMDGKDAADDIAPSLFYGPPDIIGPPKPKRIKVKLLHGWVNVYDDGTCMNVTHNTREEADRRASGGRIACVEICQPYEVEE